MQVWWEMVAKPKKCRSLKIHSPREKKKTRPKIFEKKNSVGRNVIHGSDAVESAQREIALWFPEGLAEYTPHMSKWIYE